MTLNVILSDEAHARLIEIAESVKAEKIGEALLEAIADEVVLVREQRRGSRILIEREDGSIHEMIFTQERETCYASHAGA